jgi:zinc transporter 1/2/3
MMKETSLVKRTSLGDNLFLILTLCFHYVFEGITIGVAATKANALRELWIVCLHNIFIAITMGIALLCILPKRPLLSCASYDFSFAISSPLEWVLEYLLMPLQGLCSRLDL